MSLPIPFINFIPKIFKTDSKAINLSANIDADLNEWKIDALDLKRLYRPMETKVETLDILGDMVNSNLFDEDTVLTKRKKIQNAIPSHKLRGTWADDVKLIIDSITGYNSTILTSIGTDDWILVGDGLTPSSSYWAALGVDGIDDDLGISLIGEGDEIEIAGTIYINVHSGITSETLSLEIFLSIANSIRESILPAYYDVKIGYIDGDAQFINYDKGLRKANFLLTDSSSCRPAYVDGFFWISRKLLNNIYKIDTAGNILATIATSLPPQDIFYDGTQYIYAHTGSKIIQIDKNTDTSPGELSGISAAQEWIEYDGGFIWVTDNAKIRKINPTTMASVTTINMSPANTEPLSMVLEGTNLWCVCQDFPPSNSYINIVDTIGGTVTDVIDLGLYNTYESSIINDGTYIWTYINDQIALEGKLLRIDKNTKIIETFWEFEGRGVHLVNAGDYIILSLNNGKAWKINKITTKIEKYFIVNVGSKGIYNSDSNFALFSHNGIQIVDLKEYIY